jgi:hypothetical protein
LLVRYEDVKSATADELARIAAFLSERWNRHIFFQPRGLEARDRTQLPQTRAGTRTGTGTAMAGFTSRSKKSYLAARAAIAGGWKSVLSASLVAVIESAWGDVMTSIGYELVATTQFAGRKPTGPGSSVTAQSASTGSSR